MSTRNVRCNFRREPIGRCLRAHSWILGGKYLSIISSIYQLYSPIWLLQTYWKATHPDIRAGSTVPAIARPIPSQEVSASPSADPARLGPTPPGKVEAAVGCVHLVSALSSSYVYRIPFSQTKKKKNKTKVNYIQEINSDCPLYIYIHSLIHKSVLAIESSLKNEKRSHKSISDLICSTRYAFMIWVNLFILLFST